MSQASTTSSCSPSKRGGFIFLNYPCSSVLCLFCVLCSKALFDIYSWFSSPPSVSSYSAQYSYSLVMCLCSGLGIASHWFFLSDILFIIFSCSNINLSLSARNRAISLFNSCTVSNIVGLALHGSSPNYTHTFGLVFGKVIVPKLIMFLWGLLFISHGSCYYFFCWEIKTLSVIN